MEVDEHKIESPENEDVRKTTSSITKDQGSVNSTNSPKHNVDASLQARQKLVYLLQLNLLNFHRAIIMSRRRSQQRIQRRRKMLIAAYVRQLMDIQNSYLQLMPKLHLSYKRSKEQQELKRQFQTSSQDEEDCDEKSEVDEEEEVEEEEVDVGKVREPTPPPPPQLSFYDDSVLRFDESDWLSTFRMSKSTYRWLCSQLHEALKPNGSSVPLKNLISVEKRVALVLYAFATGADYRIVAELFGVSRTSVCKFMKRFADSVIEKFSDKLIALPTSLPEYDEIRNNFKLVSNMPPLVVGVLGECELPVNPPADDLATYYNEAGNPTLFMQTLVDDKLIFRHVSIEAISLAQPGISLDSQLSKLPTQLINGMELPYFVVAPSSEYPLQSWIMCPYSFPLNPHQHDFNDAMDQLLQIKDKALFRLFARWHILERKCDLEPKTMEAIAMACCTLHNLLEEGGDGFLTEWGVKVNMSKFTNVKRGPKVKRDGRIAIKMREHLARTISSTEM